MSQARQHFRSIDALRGFAALSVALFHFGGGGLPKLSSSLTARFTSWGWTGVEVFFVISGFVIPFVMLKANYRWRDASVFLSRRLIRIWPPSAILVALTVAQYAVINRIGARNPVGWTQLSIGGIAANLLYAVPFTHEHWLNGILWTLAVEFEFYLFLASAFPLLTKHRFWLALTFAAAMLSALLPFAEAAQFLKFAIYFAMGGLALLYREGKLSKAVMLCLLAIMSLVATLELGWLPTALAAVTTVVIAFVPLQSRILVFLGTISYSLYLVHMLVGSTVEFFVIKIFEPEAPLARFSGQLFCLVVAILGAWVFYWLVERHFVDWSQRFTARKTVEPDAAAPAPL